MSKTPKTPKEKPQKITYVVQRRLVWKGAVREVNDRIDVPEKETHGANFLRWIFRRWVKKAGATEPATTTVDPSQPSAPMQVQLVALDQIRPDPTQPRKEFAADAMRELVESIREHGVEQAILVRPMSRWRQMVSFVARQWEKRVKKIDGYGIAGALMRQAAIDCAPCEEFGAAWMDRLVAEGRVEKSDPDAVGFVPAPGAVMPLTGETTLPGEPEWYEIVYGERRWRASKEAGLTEIPAKVRELSDVAAAEKQGIENLERADLLPLEVAAQYRKLLDLPGYGMERLMQVTGHAKNTIYGKLKLLELPEEARAAVQRGDLPEVTAERIGRLKGNVQKQAVKAILHAHPSDREGGKVPPDRQCRHIIEQVEREETKRVKIETLKAEATGRGLRWLEGKEQEKAISYGGEPKAESGWIKLSSTVPNDPDYRSYNQILSKKPGKAAAKVIKPVAAFASWNDSLVELYEREAVHQALEAAGVTFSKRKVAADPSEAKRRAKDKLMKAVLDNAAGVIRLKAQTFCPRVAQTPEVVEMWRALACCAVRAASNDDLRYFVRRRGFDHDKSQASFGHTVRRHIKDAGIHDLVGIVSELLLTASAWWSYSDDFGEHFRSGAAAFGVDLKRLKAEAGGGDGRTSNTSAGARNDEPELKEAA